MIYFALSQLFFIALCLLFYLNLIVAQHKYDDKKLKTPELFSVIDMNIREFSLAVRHKALAVSFVLALAGLIVARAPHYGYDLSEWAYMAKYIQFIGLVGFISLFAARTLVFFTPLNQADELQAHLSKHFPHGEIPQERLADYKRIKLQILLNDGALFLMLYLFFLVIGISQQGVL